MLSPLDVAEKDPPDLLNKKKCLEYLASLRHAKWFQVNASQELELCLSRLCVTLTEVKKSVLFKSHYLRIPTSTKWLPALN